MLKWSDLTELQRLIFAGHVCPYCERDTELVDSVEVYGRDYGCQLWRCAPCDAYVGCHRGTDVALGRVANAQLRAAKRAAHDIFDRIWREDWMSRDEAYAWLASKLGLDAQLTHIGMFRVATCERVVELCREYLRGRGVEEKLLTAQHKSRSNA